MYANKIEIHLFVIMIEMILFRTVHTYMHERIVLFDDICIHICDMCMDLCAREIIYIYIIGMQCASAYTRLLEE